MLRRAAGATSSTCHGRAPPAAQELGDRVGVQGVAAASSTAGAAGRAAAGSRRARRASCDRSATTSRAAARRAAAAGSRSAHARGGGGRVALGPAHRGQLGRPGAPGRGRSPAATAAARRRVPLPENAGSAVSCGDRARAAPGRRRRSRRPAARGRGRCRGWRAFWSRVSHSSRTTASRRASRIACRPETRRHGSTRGGGRRRGAHGLELLRGPLGLAGDGQPLGEHLAQLDQHLDVERGVAQPLGRAAGGSTSRPPSAPWPAPARARRRRPRPARRARGPSSRAPSSVSNTRLGRMPCSARPGRSCDAACSTHSTPTSASDSADRSGTAIGSISAVPAPSRRSWTR